MEKKYCPLKFQNALWTEGCYCEKEKCAWWDETHKRCSQLVMGNSLRGISATLNRVVEELIKGGKL